MSNRKIHNLLKINTIKFDQKRNNAPKIPLRAPESTKEKMKKSFNGVIGFMSHFSNEKTCLKYLESVVWDGKPVCPYCKNKKSYKFSDGVRYKCSECRKIYNVKIGTVFENTKIPMTKWFLGIYILSAHKKGISSFQLSRDLNVTQKTAWFMLQRIREMMCSKSKIQLFDKVEVDETYIGGKTKNKHLKERKRLNKNGTGHVNKTPVVGLVERGGKIQTVVINGNKVNGKILKPIIRGLVDKNAVLITDGHGGYYGLNKEFQHEVLDHTQDEFVRGEYHTNTIEGFWSLFKRGVIGIYHYVSVKHLHRYCNEFSFRYNTMKEGDFDRFKTVLTQCQGRLKYSGLTKGK